MAFEVGSSKAKKVVCKMAPKEKEEFARIALIVDDDLMMHKLHTRILSILGFKTYIAENGKQAVELCQSGAQFDLITMDFNMPIMDGIEATKALRAMGVDCKIVAVTACDEDTLKKRFMEAGVNHFFTKPLIVDELASFLNNM